MRPSAALGVFFAVLVTVFGLTLAYTGTPPSSRPVGTSKVRLAVLVVFDQMRGDYLERWRDLFGAGGFRRLQSDGAWFTGCHYPYATTTTGPGHASMLSGTSAETHGIVNNNWMERGKPVEVVAEPKYQFVPGQSGPGSPNRLEKKEG